MRAGLLPIPCQPNYTDSEFGASVSVAEKVRLAALSGRIEGILRCWDPCAVGGGVALMLTVVGLAMWISIKKFKLQLLTTTTKLAMYDPTEGSAEAAKGDEEAQSPKPSADEEPGEDAELTGESAGDSDGQVRVTTLRTKPRASPHPRHCQVIRS